MGTLTACLVFTCLVRFENHVRLLALWRRKEGRLYGNLQEDIIRGCWGTFGGFVLSALILHVLPRGDSVSRE